jgi:hypothetical protein
MGRELKITKMTTTIYNLFELATRHFEFTQTKKTNMGYHVPKRALGGPLRPWLCNADFETCYAERMWALMGRGSTCTVAALVGLVG